MSKLEDYIAVVIVFIARKVIEDWLSEACRFLFHAKVTENHLKNLCVVVINLPVKSLDQGLVSVESEFNIQVIDLAVDDALSVGLLWY